MYTSETSHFSLSLLLITGTSKSLLYNYSTNKSNQNKKTEYIEFSTVGSWRLQTSFIFMGKKHGTVFGRMKSVSWSFHCQIVLSCQNLLLMRGDWFMESFYTPWWDGRFWFILRIGVRECTDVLWCRVRKVTPPPFLPVIPRSWK